MGFGRLFSKAFWPAFLKSLLAGFSQKPKFTWVLAGFSQKPFSKAVLKSRF